MLARRFKESISMIISTGANYNDFEAVVDDLDSSLVLDAVYYVTDGTNVQKAWAVINSASGGPIVIFSSIFDPGSAPANSTFTTDFPSAVALTHTLEVK